jgi:hypothetical protein
MTELATRVQRDQLWHSRDMHAKGRAANNVTAAHAARRARSHCVHGHERTAENSYFRKDGSRVFRLCHLAAQQQKRSVVR